MGPDGKSVRTGFIIAPPTDTILQSRTSVLSRRYPPFRILKSNKDYFYCPMAQNGLNTVYLEGSEPSLNSDLATGSDPSIISLRKSEEQSSVIIHYYHTSPISSLVLSRCTNLAKSSKLQQVLIFIVQLQVNWSHSTS